MHSIFIQINLSGEFHGERKEISAKIKIPLGISQFKQVKNVIQFYR